jgi:C4-dicarboxylate-specific signal transduction histidine kinase
MKFNHLCVSTYMLAMPGSPAAADVSLRAGHESLRGTLGVKMVCTRHAGLRTTLSSRAVSTEIRVTIERPPLLMNTPMTSEQEDHRTARLLEQLLQIARISALEEMASGIAHEINQPIGAIATFAQAARRMLDRPEPMVQQTSDVLQHISQEALNAGAGIRRIRSLFDGNGRGRVECDIAEVIAELMPVLELLAKRHDTILALSIQAPLQTISIDRLRIQHVLFALVQNALEAPTRDGEAPNVRIDVTGDRYGVHIVVHDRGIGVSDTAREHMFRPFFTSKPSGTGLGLASSRAIIEAHEGTIGFESVPEGGTRFWFRLPATIKESGERTQ